MSLLTRNAPYGNPAFSLSEDQIATALDIVCRGASVARSDLTRGMLEVPITNVVRKAMKRVKRDLGLTNLQILGEHEIDDMATKEPTILGRIDIVLQFLHQFGDEEAYLAVECKRVRPGDTTLNGAYVKDGVDRFVTGQYSTGHEWGFMLGYVLALPWLPVIKYIDTRIRRSYGPTAGLVLEDDHPQAMAILSGVLLQRGLHRIRLIHALVDMGSAAP